MTKDKMVRRHHRLNGLECEQAPGDGERQGSLAQSLESQRVGHEGLTEQQQLWSIWKTPIHSSRFR